MNAIEFENVHFAYRRSPSAVLQGFNWIPPSGNTALLGPNGAGKTTLLRVGVGLLRPQKGVVKREQSSRRPGWMPQDIAIAPGLTTREQVSYAAWLQGHSRKYAESVAIKCIKTVGLGEEANKRTSALSGGQRRRMGLAQALVSDPHVIFLDEPTAGLDPGQRRRFREIMASLDSAKQIIVSTHQVDDLRDIFDYVAVMSKGHVRWQGTVSDFLNLRPDVSGDPAEAAYEYILGKGD